MVRSFKALKREWGSDNFPLWNWLPVILSPDGTKLSLAKRDSIEVWDIDAARLLFSLFGNYVENVISLVFSPDSSLLLIAAKDGIARVHNARTERPLFSLDAHKEIRRADFSKNGLRIITRPNNSEDNIVMIWDARDKRFLYTINDFEAALSFDAKRGISFSGDTAHLWTLAEDLF